MRDAVIGEAASKARAAQLARTIDTITSDAAAAYPDDRFDKDCVRQWVREFTQERGLTDEIVNALVDRLATRIESQLLRRSAPTACSGTSSTSSSSTGSGESGPAADAPPAGLVDQVANHKRKKRHLILHGPPSIEVGAWITPCGWRFGRSSEARLPRDGDSYCHRCFKHR